MIKSTVALHALPCTKPRSTEPLFLGVWPGRIHLFPHSCGEVVRLRAKTESLYNVGDTSPRYVIMLFSNGVGPIACNQGKSGERGRNVSPFPSNNVACPSIENSMVWYCTTSIQTTRRVAHKKKCDSFADESYWHRAHIAEAVIEMVKIIDWHRLTGERKSIDTKPPASSSRFGYTAGASASGNCSLHYAPSFSNLKYTAGWMVRNGARLHQPRIRHTDNIVLLIYIASSVQLGPSGCMSRVCVCVCVCHIEYAHLVCMCVCVRYT